MPVLDCVQFIYFEEVDFAVNQISCPIMSHGSIVPSSVILISLQVGVGSQDISKSFHSGD